MVLNLFKASVIGTEHKKRNIVCQDSAAILAEGSYVIGAVADGLGSSKLSEIGSEIATRVATETISKQLKVYKGITGSSLIDAMKIAFAAALVEISARAVEDGNPISDYLTTLCVCIYDQRNLYYANLGDSGLIFLDDTGHYHRITSNMQDEFGRVYPITLLDQAEYGIIKGPGSILMATDGVLKALAPSIIAPKINSAFAGVFVNEESFIPGLDLKETEKEIEDFLLNIPEDRIFDDKTIVLILDCEHKPKEIEFEIFDFVKIMEARQEEMERDILIQPNPEGEKAVLKWEESRVDNSDKHKKKADCILCCEEAVEKPIEEETVKSKKKQGWTTKNPFRRKK